MTDNKQEKSIACNLCGFLVKREHAVWYNGKQYCPHETGCVGIVKNLEKKNELNLEKHEKEIKK